MPRSPLWHPTLTKFQAERSEAIQLRAINIIFGDFPFTSDDVTLALAGFHLSKQDAWIILSVFFS